MVKVALLIGVSQYASDLAPLPGAVKDIEAMSQVLQHPDMGRFDEVRTLPDPEPVVMQEAIETLFSGRAKDDLALLFFSGHGIKDSNGRLYFATSMTRKNSKGDLIKATAVPASFVQDSMSYSRCKRQVVILDCCFSGAFAEGMTAKDDGTVDIQSQLGGEGRAVLTSSTSTQYSFERSDSDLSVYTQYIVEGLGTGAADRDQDGIISIDELHEYAQHKVQEAIPAMRPRIYAVEEGFKIHLAQAPTDDPNTKYRREFEQYARRGSISEIQRHSLNALGESLKLSSEAIAAIEAEVLHPYQERQKKIQQYEQVYRQAIQREKTLSTATQRDLKQLQKHLGLRTEDVASLNYPPAQHSSFLPPVGAGGGIQKTSKKLLQMGGAFFAGTLGLLVLLISIGSSSTSESTSSDHASSPSPSPTSEVQVDPASPSNSQPQLDSKTDSKSWVAQALAKKQQGNYQGAIADFTQAIQINANWGEENPSDFYYGLASTYAERGFMHRQLQNYSEAIEDYTQALTLRPDFAVVYLERGLAYDYQGQLQAAFDNYSQAIKLGDSGIWGPIYFTSYHGLPDAYYYRADLRYRFNHDLRGAIADYQEAAKRYQQLGILEWSQKSLELSQKMQQELQQAFAH